MKITVHGNIPCRWNSGRIIQNVSEAYQKKCLEEYAKRNIPIFLTCSNYKITSEDLNDTLSNRILALAATFPEAGIISGSELLSSYVRERYPRMIQSTSVLRVVHEHGRGKPEFYNKLAERYDRIVLHPDDGLSLNVIGKIHSLNKIEVLVNENCVRGCNAREEHCDIVCGYYASCRNEDYLNTLERFKKEKCFSTQNVAALSEFLHGSRATCNMTYQELDAVYAAGCRHFKIQGRSLSTASLLYDVTRYLLSEPAAPAVFKMIMDRLGVFACERNEDLLTADYFDWERI